MNKKLPALLVALTIGSIQMGHAQVFNSVTIGQDAFSTSYPYSYESVAAAPNANLRLQSKHSLFIHSGPSLSENFQFTGDGSLSFRAVVSGILKRQEGRFDIGPVGGAIADNPFWRGLHIYGPMTTHNGSNGFPRLSIFQESTSLTNPNEINYVFHPGNSAAPMGIHLRTSNNGNIILSPESGNVGIGTTNPTHKLAVNGTIKAKEVIVETTGWSDYVFADDYTLAPLAEVEAHIKANKHLPGIPSAAQIADQGVSVGDMQARLLAKIEELTLHQISQEKRAIQQAALTSEQAKEIAALKTKIDQLTSSR